MAFALLHWRRIQYPLSARPSVGICITCRIPSAGSDVVVLSRHVKLIKRSMIPLFFFLSGVGRERGDGVDDVASMEMSDDGAGEEIPDAAEGLQNLMERIESGLSSADNFPDSFCDSANSDLDEPVVNDEDGNFDPAEEQSQQPVIPDSALDIEPDDGTLDAGGGIHRPPWIEVVHELAPSFKDSFVLEGGTPNIHFNTKAEGSTHYPFRTKEEVLLFMWQHTHQISQKAMRALLSILLHEDEGAGFDVRGLRGVDAKHFFGRMRKFLPLLLIVGRDVPSTQSGKTSATVYDVPFNLLLDRDMRLASETKLSTSYPAGKILTSSEAEGNSMTSDHVNCVPTLPKGNIVESNMHGTLSRSTPFFGIDGVRGRASPRKVYVNDVAMCELDGTPTPCRVLELFWDEETAQVLASIRLFRAAAEVQGVVEAESPTGLTRVWEDATAKQNYVRIPVSAILDVCEIYSSEDTQANKHAGDWDLGVRSTSWGGYLGEGFVRAKRRRRRRGGDVLKPFEVFCEAWSRGGTPEEAMFSLRGEGIHHNNGNEVFFSAPVTFYSDAFNVWGMGNKVGLLPRNIGGHLPHPRRKPASS